MQRLTRRKWLPVCLSGLAWVVNLLGCGDKPRPVVPPVKPKDDDDKDDHDDKDKEGKNDDNEHSMKRKKDKD